MMRFATIRCDLWCPEHSPCADFHTDPDVPTHCEGCGHPERCHPEAIDDGPSIIGPKADGAA